LTRSGGLVILLPAVVVIRSTGGIFLQPDSFLMAMAHETSPCRVAIRVRGTIYRRRVRKSRKDVEPGVSAGHSGGPGNAIHGTVSGWPGADAMGFVMPRRRGHGTG